jgi:hypothetical protein
MQAWSVEATSSHLLFDSSTLRSRRRRWRLKADHFDHFLTKYTDGFVIVHQRTVPCLSGIRSVVARSFSPVDALATERAP